MAIKKNKSRINERDIIAVFSPVRTIVGMRVRVRQQKHLDRFSKDTIVSSFLTTMNIAISSDLNLSD